jgi:hypothetical protein
VTELQPSEVLCIPKRRRLLHSKEKDAEGRECLHIFYGEKEIVFDEPEFLRFGDKLVELERFRADEAMSWSDGAPHAWETVKEMLEALLEQEILKRVAEAEAPTAARTFPATLGLAPAGREPRTFSAHDDRCPHITQEALGRALDLPNLEAVVPVYRVAHPAMDTDGRQVGENNVFLPSLFLDLPTQRRVCNYSGNRYQADVPMNVTALKHMTSRWPELLSLTEQCRQALFARLPPRSSAPLRAGEVHLLTVCTLAAAGYVMVRGQDPVPNGQLDAGLAGMFRLVDGVRLVTTELMRATVGQHGCDRPLTAEGIADYAEKQGMYRGVHGVCAGPQALIEEYLRVLVGETSAPIQVEPSLAARVGDLDAALDYALLGQRIESMIRIFGASQGLAIEGLRVAFQGHQRTRLQDLLDEPIDASRYQFFRDDHPLVANFELEIAVNRWLFAHAGEGLRGEAPAIDALLRLDPAAQEVAAERLEDFFARVVSGNQPVSERLVGELAETAADVLALERRCLRFVRGEQRALNERLRRPSGRALTGDDLALYNRPRTGRPLDATLAEAFGLSVTTDHESTVLSYDGDSLSLAG